MDRKRALAVRRSEAVSTGIAAANDYDALPGREDSRLTWDRIPGDTLVLLRQEIHREVNTIQFAAGNGQIARLFGSAGQENGVEVAPQILHRDVASDMGIGLELHT